MIRADTERADALFFNDSKSGKGKNNTQDEEVVALNWAYNTIKNEYIRRMEIRSHIHRDKKEVNIKTKSRWTLKKLEADRKKKRKENEKKDLETGETKTHEDKKPNSSPVPFDSNDTKNVRSLEKIFLKDENTLPSNGPCTNIDSPKKRVEIVTLRDTMNSKRPARKSMIFTTEFLKTDKERLEAAKKLLSDLTEKQREQSGDRCMDDRNNENIDAEEGEKVDVIHGEQSTQGSMIYPNDWYYEEKHNGSNIYYIIFMFT